VKAIDKDKTLVAKNLEAIARRASSLVLWLDCDREGEAIAFEVLGICQSVNPRLAIYRAHFSALTKRDIVTAFNTLREPNRNLNDAVEARQEIDLRIGAAFTRLQTLTLQPLFPSLRNSVISYGPCQFPTLGFVVERFLKIQRFVPENFWKIHCKYEGPNKEVVEFLWNRDVLYDKLAASMLYEKVLQNPLAHVLIVTIDRTSCSFQ
jgi:DNA topoisomerase-3